MRLLASIRSDIKQGFLDAFRTWGDLNVFLVSKFDEPLDAKIAGDNYEQKLFHTIQYFESRDQVSILLERAIEDNADNKSLRSARAHFDLWQQTIGAAADGALPDGGPPGEGSPEALIISELGLGQDPISWRRTMGTVMKSVAQVDTSHCRGTGFLIGESCVLTAYHVVKNIVISNPETKVKFSLRGEEVGLVAGDCFLSTDNALDYALLRLNKSPGLEPIPIPMNREPIRSEALMILQHPLGGTIKFTLGRLDEVILGGKFTHNVNTLPGSSGAPCFSSDWSLLGMHYGVLHYKNICLLASLITKTMDLKKVRPITHLGGVILETI
jgi:Trypsin-like peptidase domain